MTISRREVLKWGAGAAAIWATGVKSRATEAKADQMKIPIGLQLYSVRGDCAKDLPGVLKAVSAMGYQGVEFAGYYGRTAKELRTLLDDHGLKCCGTHTHLGTITGDALKETVGFNQTIGNKYLIVPGLPRENSASAEALKKTGEFFTEVAEKVKPQGMRVGYHAHGGDHPPEGARRGARRRDRRGRREMGRDLRTLRNHRQHPVVHRRAGTLRRVASGNGPALPGEPSQDGKVILQQPSGWGEMKPHSTVAISLGRDEAASRGARRLL